MVGIEGIGSSELASMVLGVFDCNGVVVDGVVEHASVAVVDEMDGNVNDRMSDRMSDEVSSEVDEVGSEVGSKVGGVVRGEMGGESDEVGEGVRGGIVRWGRFLKQIVDSMRMLHSAEWGKVFEKRAMQVGQSEKS